MGPTGPCFETGARGYFSFEPNYSSQQKATVAGALDGFFDKSTVYDSSGQKWRPNGIQSSWQRTWWTRLVSNFYNPIISVTVLWQKPTPYSIDELKLAYCSAVDKDDDILTQFKEAGAIKARISDAKSFLDLVEVYRWMETEDLG